MLKTQYILAAAALAITATAMSFMAVTSFMADANETKEAAAWQSKAAAYQAGDSQTFETALNVDLTTGDFLPTGKPQSLRDYTQTASLMPVTYVHHKASQSLKSEQICLAKAVYYEARSERRSGQMAVAEVVQNRVKSKHYPNSICGVVYQGSGRKSGCQFSFTCDGSINKTPKGKNWEAALDVATFMQSHDVAPLTQGATHYHTTAIKPVWSTELRFKRQIGSHRFYSFRFKERPVVTAPSLAIAPPI